jgi:hypothetical protein
VVALAREAHRGTTTKGIAQYDGRGVLKSGSS